MNVSSVPNLIELGADIHKNERFASYLGDHCFQVEQEVAAEPITCTTLLNEGHNRAYRAARNQLHVLFPFFFFLNSAVKHAIPHLI